VMKLSMAFGMDGKVEVSFQLPDYLGGIGVLAFENEKDEDTSVVIDFHSQKELQEFIILLEESYTKWSKLSGLVLFHHASDVGYVRCRKTQGGDWWCPVCSDYLTGPNTLHELRPISGE